MLRMRGTLHRHLHVLSCDVSKRATHTGLCLSAGCPSVGASDFTARWCGRSFAVHSNRRAGFKTAGPLLIVKEERKNDSPLFIATIEDTDFLNRYGEVTQILHFDTKFKIQRNVSEGNSMLRSHP